MKQETQPDIVPSKTQSNWWVYITLAKDGKYYTGITTDLVRRFSEHKESKKGAKFFRGNPPVKVLWSFQCENRSTASKEEARIKKLTRKEKEILVRSNSL